MSYPSPARADEPRTLRGIPVSPGVAISTLTDVSEPELVVSPRAISPDEVEAEITRFREAVADVYRDISEIRDAMRGELGPDGAAIFDAQLMILRDPLAIDATESDIRTRRQSAEFLFRQNVLHVLQSLDEMRSGVFKERAADVRDVKRRVLRRLCGARTGDVYQRVGETIAMTGELTPSETVLLASSSAVGLVTERGGTTSHAAIVARSHRLPAVMGVRQLMEEAKPGSRAILDGWRGHLILEPDASVEARYQRLRDHYIDMVRGFELLRELPSVTRDGREVHLHANIEIPLDIETVKQNGASGVGLFRTEFFLMQRSRLPSEEEQYEAYRNVVGRMAPKPVVIRTMDLGGDKFASYIGSEKERNPFLGLRGIRFLLQHEDFFRCQLRAILRASVEGPVRILFPMLSTPEELRMACEHVRAAMRELQADRIRFDPQVPIGIMVETPAAVLMADVLARECSFFSIGTNDLTQYALAVDRTNAKLDYLFKPLHPSVLRAIRATVEAAHREGAWVSVCGEMAGDSLATALLIGLGVDDLSMSPALIPEVKQLIRSITFDEARDIATRAVRLSTAVEVEDLVHEFMRTHFPELADVKGW